MLVSGAYEKAKLYIETHSREKEELQKKKIKIEAGPCITISRQTGAAAGEISELLIDLLKPHSKNPQLEWAIFDKNLIEKVIEDHKLPEKLSEYLTEEKHSFLNSMMNELFGIHPSPLRLVYKTTKTILQLAQMGNCIIVGRAANIITRNLENTYHIRIIAPLKKRIEQVQLYFNYSEDEARKFIEKEEEKRRDYVKHYFHKDIDDPSLYDLIINTERHSLDEVAQIIACAVMKKLKKYFK
ncbi:MAG: cytidylate kinase-like family protein [Ignavibacteria bacterium]